VWRPTENDCNIKLTVEAPYIAKNGGKGEVKGDIASDPSTW